MSDDLIKEKFDNHEERISDLERNTKVLETMNYRLGQMEQSVKSINSKLDQKEETKTKDIKGWITFVIQAILTILIGYIAIKVGLK